jgi:hypothetical protein
MKNDQIKQIRDFKVFLKDMEPMVKDPKFLLNGREIPNFSLIPREAWANWLLCVVLQKIHSESTTFAEDKIGDGIILDKKTGTWIATEHVSALENPLSNKSLLKGEARVIEAINHKIKRGHEYAKNKNLIVFFDGAGIFYRNKVRENIKGRHNFNLVYGIGLLVPYDYAVTEFHDSYSRTFKVEINDNFTDWKISEIMG